MATAFDIMVEIARRAGPLVEGTATGGSATTVVDTTLLGVVEGKDDDQYNGGTAFIITDAAGLGAAPENETARITDYTASTSTVTVQSADFSVAPAEGDTYGVCAIPRGHLFSAINAALQDLGPIPFEDDTSLDTAASTLAYTLPAAAKYDLRQVWLALNTSSPIVWEEWRDWYQIKNKSTADLVFLAQPPTTRDIRLVYVGPHASVTADATAINSSVPRDYLAWRGAYHIYRRRTQQTGKDTQAWVGLMNEAADYADRALRAHPVHLPDYTTKFFSYDDPITDLPRGARIKTKEITAT